MPKKLIVTNNPMVYQQSSNGNIVLYDEKFSFTDVLIHVRNNIHAGKKLLTHPLSGSIKPYETPYKTVILTADAGRMDIDGLSIIEKSIEAANKFLINKKELAITEKALSDFQLIDLDLVKELI